MASSGPAMACPVPAVAAAQPQEEGGAESRVQDWCCDGVGNGDGERCSGELRDGLDGACSREGSEEQQGSNGGREMVAGNRRGEGGSGRGAMTLSKGRFCRVETADGQIEEIELEIALLMSPNLYRQVAGYNNGPAHKFPPIVLPKQVTPDALKLIMEYCRFHHALGRSDKERKIYDEKLIRTLDTKKLCEMASAADSLKMSPLVELTCQALAKMIEGKTPEEVREIFHLPDDLTEEEKLEPMKNAMGDPRIRLLNRLYARKRKELHEKRNMDGKSCVSAPQATDNRSVDDLLSFIDGGSAKSSKKGPRRRKKRNKDRGSDGLLGQSEEEEDGCKDAGVCRSAGGNGPGAGHKYTDSMPRLRGKVRQCKGDKATDMATNGLQPADKIQDARVFQKRGGRSTQQLDWPDLLKVHKLSFNGGGMEVSSVHCRPLHTRNGHNDLKHLGGDLSETEAVARMLNDDGYFDEDDGLDPVLKEQIDKEVEDFAKRLNVEQRWSSRPRLDNKTDITEGSSSCNGMF